MPTFCRHGRFLERCPICGKDLPGAAPSAGRAARSPRAARPTPPRASGTQRRARGEPMRIRREGRAEDDGYSSALVPGIRASADAMRLVDEIAFANARLVGIALEPRELYAEAAAATARELERATWICFLIAYLNPLAQAEDPFVGIRTVLAAMPDPGASVPVALSQAGAIALGPRTSHDPARGGQTLGAYREWIDRAGGSQAVAFAGDEGWTPERRFERLFERLALPGFGRMGRYELLVTLGRIGAYELQADGLHLGGVSGGGSSEDATILAAKRVFGIGDPLLLDRRAAALAAAVAVPVETLDLALANWAAPIRATMGFPAETADDAARERAFDALIA
jgi:hypothetical protein